LCLPPFEIYPHAPRMMEEGRLRKAGQDHLPKTNRKKANQRGYASRGYAHRKRQWESRTSKTDFQFSQRILEIFTSKQWGLKKIDGLELAVTSRKKGWKRMVL